jgi:hypothetical protein
MFKISFYVPNCVMRLKVVLIFYGICSRSSEILVVKHDHVIFVA